MSKYTEAIKEIKKFEKCHYAKPNGDADLSVYENLKVAKEALEKQIPQSPLYRFDGNEHKVVCPNCKHYEFDTGFYEWANLYCGECGQAIDWSDTE